MNYEEKILNSDISWVSGNIRRDTTNMRITRIYLKFDLNKQLLANFTFFKLRLSFSEYCNYNVLTLKDRSVSNNNPPYGVLWVSFILLLFSKTP